MSIPVEGPDGVIHEFPDDTTPEEIDQVISEMYGAEVEAPTAMQAPAPQAPPAPAPAPQPPPQDESWIDRAMRDATGAVEAQRWGGASSSWGPVWGEHAGPAPATPEGQAAQGAAERAWANVMRQVPNFQADKSPVGGVIRPLVRAGGRVVGAVEEAATALGEDIGDALFEHQDSIKAAIDPNHVKLPMGQSNWQRGYDDAERDAQERLEQSGIAVNTVTDGAENIEAIIQLGSELAGFGEKFTESEAAKWGVGDLFQASRTEGGKMGRAAYEGITGGTLYVLTNPVDSFRARPITTFLTIGGPAVKALKASGHYARLTPKGRAALELIERRASDLQKQLSRATPERVKEAGATVKRVVADETILREPEAMKVLREMLFGGARTKAAVKGAGERLASEAMEGGIVDVSPKAKAAADADYKASRSQKRAERMETALVEDEAARAKARQEAEAAVESARHARQGTELEAMFDSEEARAAAAREEAALKTLEREAGAPRREAAKMARESDKAARSIDPTNPRSIDTDLRRAVGEFDEARKAFEADPTPARAAKMDEAVANLEAMERTLDQVAKRDAAMVPRGEDVPGGRVERGRQMAETAKAKEMARQSSTKWRAREQKLSSLDDRARRAQYAGGTLTERIRHARNESLRRARDKVRAAKGEEAAAGVAQRKAERIHTKRAQDLETARHPDAAVGHLDSPALAPERRFYRTKHGLEEREILTRGKKVGRAKAQAVLDKEAAAAARKELGSAIVATPTRVSDYKGRVRSTGTIDDAGMSPADAKAFGEEIEKRVARGEIAGEQGSEAFARGQMEVRREAADVRWVHAAIDASDNVKRIIDETSSRLGGDKGENAKRFRDTITRAVSRDLPQIMRAPKLRSRVITVAKGMILREADRQGLTGRARKRFIKDSVQDVASHITDMTANVEGRTIGGVPFHKIVKEILDPDPVRLKRLYPDDSKRVKKILDEAPSLRRQIMGEAVLAATEKLAGEEHIRHMRRELEAEASSLAEGLYGDVPAISPQKQAEVIAAKVAKGGSPPGAIRGRPDAMKTIIEEVEKLAKSDPSLEPLVARLKKYEPLNEEVGSYLRMDGKEGPVPEGENRAPLPDGEEKVNQVIFVPRGFNRAMELYAKSERALGSNSLWARAYRALRANLTARRIGTLVNNVTANVAMQIMRRGEALTPADLKRAANLWNDFKHGKVKDAATRSKLEALERTGLVDATVIEAELGSLKRSGLLDKVPGGKAAWAPMRGLERLYRASDNIFKLDEAIRTFDQTKKFLDDVGEGEWFDFRIGPNEKARLTRTKDGWTLNGKKVPEGRLDDVIARRANTVAQDLFFDYSVGSGFQRWLGSLGGGKAGIVTVVSPFFRWYQKAMWIPGVKRGLPLEIIKGPLGDISTSSKRLNAKLMAEQAKVTARQVAVAQGARASMERDDIPKILDRMVAIEGRNVASVVWNLGTNPAYKDWSAANAFGATDTFFRAMAALPVAVGNIFGAYERKDLYPDDDMWLQKLKAKDPEAYAEKMMLRSTYERVMSGQLFATEDLLELVSMKGSPITDLFDIADKGEQKGGHVDVPYVVRQAAPFVVGGTYASLADVVVGLLAPDSHWTSRPVKERGKVTEEGIEWAIRRVTGLGWKPLDIQRDSKRYFEDLGQGWRSAWTSPLDRAAKQGDKEAIREIARRKAIVNRVVKEMEREFHTATKNLRRRPKTSE